MNLFIDFEATQFSNKIISIGCEDENGESFNTLMKPVGKAKLTDFITKLTGITDADLAEAPSTEDAFNSFFDWLLAKNYQSALTFYCYGDADKGFLHSTMHHTTDTRALACMSLILANLVDYSKQLKMPPVNLNKLYNFLKEEDNPQKHDALEDARMLHYIVDKYNADSIDQKALAATPNNNPNKPAKNKAPDIFISWSVGGLTKWTAPTDATNESYFIKCENSDGAQYFFGYETAALWLIRFYVGGSPKKKTHVDALVKKIENAIKNNKKYCGLDWSIAA